MIGTYLLVKVDHVSTRVFAAVNISRKSVGGIPPLTSRTLQKSRLQLFADVHRRWLVMLSSPRLNLQAARYSHLRTSRSSWKLGCNFDSGTADTSIPARIQEADGGFTFGEGFFIIRQFVQGIKKAEQCLFPFRGASFVHFVSWRGCP